MSWTPLLRSSIRRSGLAAFASSAFAIGSGAPAGDPALTAGDLALLGTATCGLNASVAREFAGLGRMRWLAQTALRHICPGARNVDLGLP